ncbi:hypothetical protein K227x_38950 [Rubripirellula lacrimiformis]|uniref:Ice-binding protein C-terminal domain-containing protein n=2 Tax=Rubripirellula lacrimiformis TaxID=1930273 RepID=A0A517NED5_9BACT|nr:hypothetical protein K227x_38950 [Rubripirellula lacrimiformis]
MARLSIPTLSLALAAMFSSVASAAIYVPGGTSVPGTSSDVFTWSAGAANSTFALWDNFVPPGPSAPGFSPNANSSLAIGPDASSLTFNTVNLITSGGNAYSFGNKTDASSTIRSGTTGGGFTRIVAQFETDGNELDYSSLLLTTGGGVLSPSLAIETDRGPGAMGPDQAVSFLAMWDLDSSQAEYQLDFNADGPDGNTHMSLLSYRVDSFTQASSFSPQAVPEPSTWAALGLVGGAAVWRRRSRRGTNRSQA